MGPGGGMGRGGPGPAFSGGPPPGGPPGRPDPRDPRSGRVAPAPHPNQPPPPRQPVRLVFIAYCVLTRIDYINL